MEDPAAGNPPPQPPPSSSAEKTSEEPAASPSSSKTAQCSAVSVYRTKIAGAARHVTVAWTKSLINHSFSVSVDLPDGGGGGGAAACKVELKPWPFWSKKGYKSLDVVGGARVDVFWDLRTAKFSGSGSPEPSAGYYVALVFDEEVVLLVGDGKKDAYKRSKSRPALEDAVLVCKKESVLGKRCFAARARFGERSKEHDIVVETAIGGSREPEMRISVDGAVLVRVGNLRWKFRGNATVLVDELPVQVLWDVHDWLFAGPGSGGLFVFKPAGPPDDPHHHHHSEEKLPSLTSEDCCRPSSEAPSEFCFYLYAWKIE